MENRGTYQRAEKRVKAKLRFYFHLSIYIAVNILVIVNNFSMSTPYAWSKWPLIGWGIGLLFS
jgi:hypothetical protein